MTKILIENNVNYSRGRISLHPVFLISLFVLLNLIERSYDYRLLQIPLENFEDGNKGDSNFKE